MPFVLSVLLVLTSALISPFVRPQASSAQASRSGSHLKATPPRADDLRRQAQEQFDRGEAHLDRDDFPAAVRCFQESLKLARQLSDDSLASRILWKLADVHIVLLQDYEKALRFAGEALSAARTAGDRHEEARAIDHVGNAYFSLGNYAKALENFRASLTIMQQVGDRYGEAVALKDLGIASKFVGRYDDALESLVIVTSASGITARFESSTLPLIVWAPVCASDGREIRASVVEVANKKYAILRTAVLILD